MNDYVFVTWLKHEYIVHSECGTERCEVHKKAEASNEDKQPIDHEYCLPQAGEQKKNLEEPEWRD